MSKFEMYDCGCAKTRPKTSRYYASRWKVYISATQLTLRCLDCSGYKRFELRKEGVQISHPFPTGDLLGAEMSGLQEIVSTSTSMEKVLLL